MLTTPLLRTLRKALLPAILLPCACMTAIADDALVVNFHDGTKAYYQLSSTPEVTFEGNLLCVRAGDAADKHEFEKVDTFTFGEYVSVDAIEAEGARILCPDKSTVLFRGFRPGTVIKVADASGRLWFSDTVGDDGAAAVDVGDLPSGIYIISTSMGQTIKIVKA